MTGLSMPVDTRVSPRRVEHHLVEAPKAWAEDMSQEAKLSLRPQVMVVAPTCLSQPVVKNGRNEAQPLGLGVRLMPMVKQSSAM